jgi:hypothetical protein
MVSESGLLYDLLGYDTADSQVDLHRLADRRNKVLGFFMPCIFRSRVPFPLSPPCVSTTISPVNLPEAGSSRNAGVLQAKSSVHGVEHRTQRGFILRLPFMTLRGQWSPS